MTSGAGCGPRAVSLTCGSEAPPPAAPSGGHSTVRTQIKGACFSFTDVLNNDKC